MSGFMICNNRTGTQFWVVLRIDGLMQTAVTPLRTHWGYRSLALTNWGRVTHICVSKLTIIGSDNGLSLGRRQAIIYNNARILLIGPFWTNCSEISIEIRTFLFKNMHRKCCLENDGHFVSASICLASYLVTRDITSRAVPYIWWVFCIIEYMKTK